MKTAPYVPFDAEAHGFENLPGHYRFFGEVLSSRTALTAAFGSPTVDIKLPRLRSKVIKWVLTSATADGFGSDFFVLERTSREGRWVLASNRPPAEAQAFVRWLLSMVKGAEFDGRGYGVF